MGHLDGSVSIGIYKEIYVAATAQVILRRETREGGDATLPRTRGGDRGEDVGRPARAAECHQEIARPSMQVDLFGEHVLITEIVAEPGERRGIVESERAHTAVLGEIDRQMAADSRAAAVADEHHLVAGRVGGARNSADPL